MTLCINYVHRIEGGEVWHKLNTHDYVLVTSSYSVDKSTIVRYIAGKWIIEI